MVYRPADSTFWIAGSKDGRAAASHYDGQSWQVLDPGVDTERLHSPLVTASGDIWFGTNIWPRDPILIGNGAMHYNPSGTGQAAWTLYTTDDGLLHNRIYEFGQSPDGIIWAGTFEGISWFDGTAWSHYEHGFPGAKALGFEVSGADMWCTYGGAGGLGVSRYRSGDGPGQSAWRTYRMRDGLASELTREVLPDPDGTVWVATDNGISHFDPRTDLWASYTEENGLWPGVVNRLWLERDGSLGYTSQTGLAGMLTPDQDPPETLFEVTPTEVGSSGNIQLTWSGRDLWDVTPQAKVRYQHRIDDGDWSPWTPHEGAILTSLSPGHHRIELRAADDELNVDPTPAVHAFVVEPPWWQNPVVAGPGLFIIAFALFQTVRVVQRDRRLQESVDALSAANNDLFQVNVDLQREHVLERLRGQALGMQSSDEIGGMVESVFKELRALGLPLISSGIGFANDEITEAQIWVTSSDGKAVDPLTWQLLPNSPAVHAFERGETHYHVEYDREQFKETMEMQAERGNPVDFWDLPEDRWPDRIHNYGIFFDRGHVHRVQLSSAEVISEDNINLIRRFGEAFGFAHARWEELNVKEAQNRRLAVEASVQRLRAEVQSMDEASDFERILSLLTESLKMVELTFDGCEIDVLDEPVENPTMEMFEASGFRYTTYTLDPNGRVASEAFAVAAPFPGVIRQTVERFIAGEPWQGQSEGEVIVEVPAGAYGRLRLTAADRQNFDDDEVATLREFADSVALGYARYLDIRVIQEQTERKSAFLASMSHELRTPMNAIKGFARRVLRASGDILPDRQKENLQKVDQASDHLLAMLNDLLDLSKIEAGRMDVSPERFDVRELIASACDTVSPLIQEGVELRQNVADELGEANTDKARVQQMVINLLSNAIKFTDTGSVTVSATNEDGQLVIAVSDTGKGIPADELPTIFDEYRQAEGSESSVQKGTGLGLSITKKFAELLGGTIGVESEVGKGSTFTVRVPTEYQPPEA